jgi:hypothetical protein
MTNVRQVALVAVHLASHAPGRSRYELSRREVIVSRRPWRQCGQPEGGWTAEVVGGRAEPSSAGVDGHRILQG